MFRPRVIPVLLLRNLGLVKSLQFRNYRYIGDPINAVKLFNDLGADELVFLDILASNEKRTISLDFVRKVGDEANMPFSVGGGVRNLKAIQQILNAGAEKIILNTIAAEDPDFIKNASEEFGSSTIVVSMDVKKTIFGKELIVSNSGKKPTKYDPVSFAMLMEDKGAGEIIINSIEHDGMMEGYNLSLIKRVSEAVRVPVIALSGAGTKDDLRKGITEGYASAVAAGSMFIYHGPRKAVLINYPANEELITLFNENSD
jgi:cyclase